VPRVLGANDSTIANSANDNYDTITDNVIRSAAEIFLNDTTAKDVIGSIKLLPTFNSSDFYTDQNATLGYEPKIPDYITLTSMIFCIAIMCLGVIGNTMVSEKGETASGLLDYMCA
jgi:hypothetical protein